MPTPTITHHHPMQRNKEVKGFSFPKEMSGFTEISIRSNDINRSKFSPENHNALKSQFPHLDDDTIARYLLARNNDLGKATELLSKAQRWRAMHFPILKQDCINELNKGIHYTHGVDKEGRPLFIVHAVRHDPKNRNIEELAKSVLWMMEHVIRRLPNDKSKYTILIDRTDAGVFNQDIEFSRHFSKLFQDQHPERLHRAIVYPSGMVFWSVWNIVKWFMDPVTRAKVAPVIYLAGVQEFIDDDNIPVTMGGKAKYEFSSDHFEDPYPEEVIQEALAKRARGEKPTSDFFNPDVDAASGNYDANA